MPEYRYSQRGLVAELMPLKKAIITFNAEDREQRALLWGRRLVCGDGRPLPEDKSISDELAIGDEMIIDCHVYDNDNNQDRCTWFVARAEKAVQPEQLSDVASNVTGTVDELTPTRGFVVFEQVGRPGRQRAVFLAERYYEYGQLREGSSLFQRLEEGMKVHMDAVRCPGRLQGADWYAMIVWRGARPDHRPDPEPPEELLLSDEDEDEAASRPAPTLSDNLFPALSSADCRSRRQPQAVEKWGYVSSLLNAEYGVLLWPAKPRKYESVLFHRSTAHLFDLNLTNYDLRTIFKKGDHLRFEAVPSEHAEAYRWKATCVWVES